MPRGEPQTGRQRLLTISGSGNILLNPTDHGLPWLQGEKENEIPCVVHVVWYGKVRIWRLEQWSADHHQSEGEASQLLESAENDLTLDPLPACLRPAKRQQSGRGKPTYSIRLPDLALFTLFDHGEGPLYVQQGSSTGVSGRVLLTPFSAHAELDREVPEELFDALS